MARVLVIDDEQGVRILLHRALAAQGHEVLEAGDGKTAMLHLRQEAVDLVITDLYMPYMDGVEFTIRLSQHTPRPKIIAISGGGHLDKEEALETVRRLGADATLEKPFSVEHLLDLVRAVLGGAGER